MQVPIDPDENFLHQILGLLPITDCAIYEVQEPGLITLHQLRKSPLFPTKECRHDSGIVHCPQSFPDRRPLIWNLLFTSSASHKTFPKKDETLTTREPKNDLLV